MNNKPFIVRTKNGFGIFIAFFVTYIVILLSVYISHPFPLYIFADRIYELLLIIISPFLIPILIVNTKITLIENQLMYKHFFFIKKRINLDEIKEITIKKKSIKNEPELITDIIFLDGEEEEICRINVKVGYYKEDDINELIKRLKKRIKITYENDNSFGFS